jgi:hypothetical protein
MYVHTFVKTQVPIFVNFHRLRFDPNKCRHRLYYEKCQPVVLASKSVPLKAIPAKNKKIRFFEFDQNEQMVKNRVARWFIFKTKNPNLGKFWMALEWKMLVYFMGICNILRTYYESFGFKLVYFGILFQEKSGNPG